MSDDVLQPWPGKHSRDYVWLHGPKHTEWFRYGARYVYAVHNAKAMIDAAPRPVFVLKVASVERMSRMIATQGDIPKGDAITDLPIILATERYLSPDLAHETYATPIDGWHRIRGALDAGVAELPCVVLTEEESLAAAGVKRARRKS